MKRGNQMKNDLQISQETELEPIVEVASKLDLKEDDLELYGKYKAKINFSGINRSKDNAEGHLILVTSNTSWRRKVNDHCRVRRRAQ